MRQAILERKVKVSVPLRGLWFLSVSYVHEQNGQTYSCFRPLAGIMVLIIIASMIVLKKLHGVVSVPLRGLWFLSLIRDKNSIVYLSECFRPLAGIMVLICI